MAEKFNENINEESENIIELTDETTGETVQFEHLDTVEMDGKTYFVLTELFEEEPEESDVYIMTIITDEDGNEILEIVEDKGIVMKVFEEFRSRCDGEFDFVD
ncbi:MAG: DUF1292 domain-containing protein [Clostridia bacterium]|nr:DUF1292 domain-containing protein [Clostridia bacterium]